MLIKNSTHKDLPEIFRLYAIASDYQRSINAPVIWPEFEQEMVKKEIREGHQWKMLIDGAIACIWATTFSDELIWLEKNSDSSVYIHRIAVNPDFRGRRLVQKIVEWAIPFAKKHGKEYVRLDTIGENERLIRLYTNAGFQFLGMFPLKNTEGLPKHYSYAPAALFEIKLSDNE